MIYNFQYYLIRTSILETFKCFNNIYHLFYNRINKFIIYFYFIYISEIYFYLILKFDIQHHLIHFIINYT